MERRVWAAVLAAVMICCGCSGRAPERETGALTENFAGAAGEENDPSQVQAESENAAETAAEADTELTVWLGNDFLTLDPANAIYNSEKTMLSHLYETLFVLDEENRLTPGQAESYEVSADGKTYTFHLRKGLKWSDGSELTASDYVYAWKRLANASTASPYAYDLLHMVEGYEKAADGDAGELAVSARDERTLEVRLSEPYFGFAQSCTAPALSPLKQDAVEQAGRWDRNPDLFVGNGPMKVAEYTGGSHITLVKNEHYRNARAVSLKSVTFLLKANRSELLSDYQNDEVALMKAGPEQKEEAGFCQVPLSGISYILFNLEQEALQDVRVRNALSMAVDREYVTETVMEGTAVPAYSLIAPGLPDGEETEDYREIWSREFAQDWTGDSYEDNLAEAGALLAEAGYPEGKGLPEIEFLTCSGNYNLAFGEYLKQAWKQLGVQTCIREVSWNYFAPYRHAGDFMAARGSWVLDGNDPMPILMQFEGNHYRNDSRYSSPETNRLLSEARRAADRSDYYQKMHQAEQQILADCPVIPIAFYQESWLCSPAVEGIWHSPEGVWHLQNACSSERGE